jgi:hypothetical protein
MRRLRRDDPHGAKVVPASGELYISRAEGWDNRKLKNGTWRNYCPRCSEEADPDLDFVGLGFTKKPASDE